MSYEFIILCVILLGKERKMTKFLPLRCRIWQRSIIYDFVVDFLPSFYEIDYHGSMAYSPFKSYLITVLLLLFRVDMTNTRHVLGPGSVRFVPGSVITNNLESSVKPYNTWIVNIDEMNETQGNVRQFKDITY